jgi:lactate permease
LQEAGRTQWIKKSLASLLGEDSRIQALVLAWFFCAFLEGAAGFGAPAAVVAPLMLSLGFAPITAATLPLIGDSAAVAFGAVGTPIRIGFQGLAANFIKTPFLWRRDACRPYGWQ